MTEDNVKQRRAVPNYFQATRSGIMLQSKPVFFYLEKLLVKIQTLP
jgi:hypothetical protein